MRQKIGVAVSVGIVVAMLIVGSLMIAFPIAGGSGSDIGLKARGPKPFATGTSPKTTVIEVFTGTWCPPCANADPAISRVMDEYSPDNFILLMYHLSNPDPYINPASNTRATFYGINFVPTSMVNGGGPYANDTNWLVGAYAQKSQNYDNFRSMIDPEYPAGAPMEVTLDADLTGSQVQVRASIHQTDLTNRSNLVTRFVLYEDALYYLGSNQAPYHRAVVRDVIEVPLTILQGQTVQSSATFNLQGSWNKNKLGVATMVQTNTKTAFQYKVGVTWYTAYNAEILNAARVDFVQPGITVFRDEPVTDYTEGYEKLLSQERALGQPGYHFSTFDILSPMDQGVSDIRGPPTAADLANRPMVVWSTGSRGLGATIDPTEQALLQNYVANTNGNLLVSGENVGADIGTTPFYQNVLQANFVSDIAGGTMIQGVAGDPVSSSWASSALTFGGSSPDAVSARNLASVSFTYQGSGQGAAVRSDFDADSRVLYFGVNFLEGTDPARKDVLGSAVRWFDGKAPPVVGVTFPNGGETLAPSTPYKLTWSARDVEVPANAVDIYFTADSSNPTWTLIAAGEPNDGVYWWSPPSGIDSPLCLLKVVARDGQGNVGQDLSNADFTIGSPVIIPFSVGLVPGLNLVSIPITPIGSSITAILASLDPWYSAVWTFDPATGAWKSWHRGEPSNSLTTLDLKMGFWVELTGGSPRTLTVNGVPPTTTSIALAAGYNLVGFPSSQTGVSVASVKAATGATMIVGFSGSAAPGYTRVLGDSEILVAGNGYYLYTPAVATWIVTY